MIKPNFKAEPNVKTKILSIDKFGGKNTKDAEEEIQNFNASDLSNVRIDGERIFKRPGHAVKGASEGATTATLGMYDFHQSGTVSKLLMGYNTTVQYWTGSAWSDAITGLTANKEQTFATFSFQGATTSETGTATSGTKYSLTDTGQGWTTNAYRNKFITLDGGTGSGQVKLIISNDTDTITIQSPWDTVPSTDTTFTIYTPKTAAIVSNGTDSPRIYDGTSATTKTRIPIGKYVTVHNDRLFILSDDILYYSDLFNGEEFPSLNSLPIEPNSNAGVATGMISLGEQLVITKQYRTYVLSGYFPEQFELIPRSRTVGCIAPKTLIEGNNVVFFLSTRGIEEFNVLETQYLDDYFTLSDPVDPTLNALSKTTACSGFYDNKLYCSLGTNNSTTFIYDVRTSKSRFTDFTRRETQAQLLQDTGYTPNCWCTAIESGVEVLYHGDIAKGQVYTSESGNDDEGSAIALSWESKNYFLGQNHSLNKMWISADQATNNELGSSTTQFDITNPSGTTIRYTWDTTGTDPEIATHLAIGSIVVIAAQNFDSGNNGTFTVTAVGASYFEITNADGVAETNKTIGTGSIISSTMFTFQVSADSGSYQTIATIDMNDISIGRYGVKLSSKIRGTYFKFKMTNTDSNANVKIQKLEYQLIPDIVR